ISGHIAGFCRLPARLSDRDVHHCQPGWAADRSLHVRMCSLLPDLPCGYCRPGKAEEDIRPMIEFRRVNKYYGAHRVLRDITMRVSRGEVVVVCGPSGSGKSTLIKCVNALEPYQDGHILVDGIDVGSTARSPTHLRQRVGMVFQNFELYPHLSVL